MITSPNSLWTVRSPKGSDLPFLYASWLNSYRSDSNLGRTTKKSVYYREYNDVLDAIFSKPLTRCLVACLPNDDDIIVGFLVYEASTIHYAYTKEDFRRFGIAKSLYRLAFPGAGAAWFTHKTSYLDPILEKHPEVSYNPFILFSRRTDTTQEDPNGERKEASN